MNQKDQQAIEELFRYLERAAAQAPPPDKDADALIQRHLGQQPGLTYQMAQTLVAQQATINQLRAQLAAYQRQAGGAPAGFAQPAYQGYGQPGYQPGYPQQGYQQYGRQGGGFLAGAGQLALGIGGGIIGAEMLTSLFDGVGNMFDGDRDEQYYDDGYQAGFDAGDRDQGYDQDQGGYDNSGGNGDFGGGSFDDGGGGFDDGGGIF